MAKKNYFSTKMVNKTEAQLREYINNRSQFRDAAVLAAIWELEKRELAGDDAKSLKSQIEKKNEPNRKKEEQKNETSNIVNNPDAPLLYHPKFILVFGSLFSVFGGGILMAMNFSRLGKRNLAWVVVITSLLYSTLQVIVLNFIAYSLSVLTVSLSLLGMALLEALFWKRQVSDDLKFRMRSMWAPILIALIIFLPVLLLLFL